MISRASPIREDLTDYGAVGVCEPQAGGHDERRHLRHDREAVCSRPTLVSVGEMRTEIAEPGGTEHGVRHCVCHDVCIAVTFQTILRLETDTPQHQHPVSLWPTCEGVLIKADPYP